jgi:hypothetical protein
MKTEPISKFRVNACDRVLTVNETGETLYLTRRSKVVAAVVDLDLSSYDVAEPGAGRAAIDRILWDLSEKMRAALPAEAEGGE